MNPTLAFEIAQLALSLLAPGEAHQDLQIEETLLEIISDIAVNRRGVRRYLVYRWPGAHGPFEELRNAPTAFLHQIYRFLQCQQVL